MPAHWPNWRACAKLYRMTRVSFELTGYILRRRGQQEEGLRNLQRAVELDPRNFYILQQIALSYQHVGAFCRGDRCAGSRAKHRARQRRNAHDARTYFISSGKETLGRSTRRLMQSSRKDQAPLPARRTSGFMCALAERDPAAAERALVALGDNPCSGEGRSILSHSFGEGFAGAHDQRRGTCAHCF